MPRKCSAIRLLFILTILSEISACGTYVPQVAEFYENAPGDKNLELKIKEQIFCELQSAVYNINNNPYRKVNFGGKEFAPIPEKWGVTTTITLQVLENSALNPSLSIISPPPSAFFTQGFGGSLSSDATRIDKYTFFYLVKDLENNNVDCKISDGGNTGGRKLDDLRGSSFLLTSDLGIQPWLDNAADLLSSRGIPVPSKGEVLSYNVKFVVATGGNVTPSWSLVRVKTGSSDFLTAKRERTHELLLTFGATDEQPKSKNKTNKQIQPGPLALSDNIASQIGSAVANNIRNINR